MDKGGIDTVQYRHHTVPFLPFSVTFKALPSGGMKSACDCVVKVLTASHQSAGISPIKPHTVKSLTVDPKTLPQPRYKTHSSACSGGNVGLRHPH